MPIGTSLLSIWGIDKPLNYRRNYSNRVIRNVPDRVKGAEQALNTLFENPTCPPEISALKSRAFANTYLVWSYEAFMAELTHSAQKWLLKAVELCPEFVADRGADLSEFIIDRSIHDGGDHNKAIRRFVDQLPVKLKWIEEYVTHITAQADLRAGIREVMWGRTGQGDMLLKRAALANSAIDQDLLRLLVDQLLNYRTMVGDDAAQLAMHRLQSTLRTVASHRELQWMKGCYWLNRSFESYFSQDYAQTRENLLQAIWANPGNIRNRGAWSMLMRSFNPFRRLDRSSIQWNTQQLESPR